MNQEIEKVRQLLGYNDWLPIQKEVMPILLRHQDCIVQSPTGSGKTLAYILPIIQNIKTDEKKPQALILSPTRELALQIQKEINVWGTYKKIKSVCLIGKQPYTYQKQDLNQRCHMVTGTPGRVLMHLEQGNFKTEKIQYVIIDEADKMFEQNFKDDIAAILAYIPKPYATCLISATINEDTLSLTSSWLNHPCVIQHLNEKPDIIQYKLVVQHQDPFETVLRAIMQEKPDAAILFCRTQEKVDELYAYLEQWHIHAQKIHAGLSQEERQQAIKDFKVGKVNILVATDVASRGLDIEDVQLIINVDIPDSKTIYTHRIGRSGRVHSKGLAITLAPNASALMDLPEYSLSDDFVDEERLSFLNEDKRHRQNQVKQVRQHICKLYINAGKKKKIRAGDIVGALCAIDGVTKEDIGVIQIQDHQSYIDIFHGKENVVFKHLKTIKHKHVKVEAANQ